MEILPSKAPVKQSSIRSFFQPRTNPPPRQIQEQQPELPDKEFEEEESANGGVEVLRRNAENCLPLPRAVISVIESCHIQPLKRINALLLPITYPNNFYNDILAAEAGLKLSYVLLWNSPRPSNPSISKEYTLHKEQQVIGGIVCRLEQHPQLHTSAVYIQSLALLSPYRSQGLAAALLDTVIRTVVQLPSPNPAPSSLYAHVWTENTEALAWYNARGFVADPAPIQNYYSRLRPSTAFLLRRHINPSDYLRHKSSTASITISKHGSDDWEMVESPNMASKPVSAPASLPFIAPPPTTSPEPPQKSSKKSKTQAQTYLNFPPAPAPIDVSLTSASNPPNRPSPLNKPASPLRPSMVTHTESFQNRAPDREWNDLPLDLLGAPNKTALSRTTSVTDTAMGASAASSRSSSSSRTAGKKKRHYPAAAFGSAGSEAAAR